LEEIYTFLVRGPSSRLPRGYIWLIPIWFVILGSLVALASRDLSGKLTPWLAATEVGGTLLAGAVVMSVLFTVRRHAFRANSEGIWIGILTTRKRPKLRQVHIPWADISVVRMAHRRYGVLLEISLAPSAEVVIRPGAGEQILLWLGSLVMPFGFGRGRPALTAARPYPPRYLIKVCDVTPSGLRQVLAELRPPEIPVRILTKSGAMRFAPLPRRRSSPQPTGAAITR